MFFSATDIDGKIIDNELIKQDIQKEYLDKTLTIEPFPFLENVSMATVHPCKHANVLKSMSDTMRENQFSHIFIQTYMVIVEWILVKIQKIHVDWVYR